MSRRVHSRRLDSECSRRTDHPLHLSGRMMMDQFPIDGFSVTRVDDTVQITLSNRYGQIFKYAMTIDDAHFIGNALLASSEDVWEWKE